MSTIHSIFITNPSFYSRFFGQRFLKIKFWNFSHMGRLGANYWFWGKWTENGLSVITLQPLRFSQIKPHFVQRVSRISFKPSNWGNLELLWVWDLIQCFGPIVPKTVYLTYSITDHPIFRTNHSFCSELYGQHFTKLNSKILVLWGD